MSFTQIKLQKDEWGDYSLLTIVLQSYSNVADTLPDVTYALSLIQST